ncbi:hypothetical protein EHQ58_12875 [Leptospira ognonensis]|uniref:Glycosyltransferase RgtA/B/C/D-like domain-containing protein n=1 Tax=Leptospira ognonensis TaxID=2484945 RepID=A0A4R9JW22_9LEPT|nr:hypothetical protein [Leptospira ognonensis]TGL57194.1 hypothetical protein EHQ58_12875 [Leptospira ognonensis]
MMTFNAKITFTISILIISFLLLTTLNLSFFESIDWVQANDVYSYLKISLSYPQFPHEQIASHFAYRFVPHYFVGFLASFFSIEIGTSYSIVNFIFSFGIIYFSIRTIQAFHPKSKISVLFVLIFLVSPFVLRLNLFSPGLLADTVHIFGLVLCLYAVGIKKIPWLLVGIFFAAIGKQFIILELPGLLFLMSSILKDNQSKLEAILWVGLLIVYTVFLYFGLNYLGKSFADPIAIGFRTFFSFFFWVFSAGFSYRLLFEHFFRLLLPVFPFIILFFGLRNLFQIKRMITLKNIGFLFVFLAPLAYGFLPGPEVQMGNQSRYSSVGLLALVLLLLDMISDFDFSWDYRIILLSIFYLLMHTYHHKYTIFDSVQIVTLSTQLVSYVILYFLLHLMKDNKKPKSI